jgi:hypothetical protein
MAHSDICQVPLRCGRLLILVVLLVKEARITLGSDICGSPVLRE